MIRVVVKMRQQIEALLWSRGLTPNYRGFAYLAYILELAGQGHPIDHNTLALVAQAHGATKSSVHQAVTLALRRMELPRSLPGPDKERFYLKINYLYRQL